MKELCRKYIDNLSEGHSLVKKNLMLTYTDRKSLLEQVRENAARTSALRRENEDILQMILYAKAIEEMTPEDIETLQAFASELFVYMQQNDVGVAFQIHQLLYQYAELHEDYDLRVRQLYHMGMAMYYINPIMEDLGINLFGKQVTNYFSSGSEDFERLAEVKNPETRKYILRCINNLYTTDERVTCCHQPGVPYDSIARFPEYQRYFNYLLKAFCSPENRELMPEYDWDLAVFNLHYDRSLYYQFIQKHHPPEILESILESAAYTFHNKEHIPASDYSHKEISVAQIYATTRWKAGLITATELADEIGALLDLADPDDFSLRGITLNLQMPIHFEEAYRAMNREERKLYEAKMLEIDKRTQNYLLRAPHNEYNNQVTKAVGESIRYRARHNLPLQKKFFDTLLYCHPPTYIHVRVAAYLSRIIFKRMVEVAPENLLGIYDIYDVDEIRERCEELSVRVYSCALYHDVGKILLLDYVGNYDRKILDEEFSAIRLHAEIGATLLGEMETAELAVVARHHHRFYNEVGGYPENCRPCPTQFKPIVDIVTVCDSIEAATDDIGRCYAKVKDFSTLVDELRWGSGTRYSPHVVALFDDEEFFRTVEQGMYTKREEIYFETYEARQRKGIHTEN